MAITKKDIEHTASLARIKLTEDEIEKLSADLAKILDYVGQLRQVDTSGVNPDLSDTHQINQTREDEASDSGIQDVILGAAPKRKAGYFEVKGVFE
jgi:aspartyl-tRNA(Asn)/glutamyl-tRNA(Gln) amidotransferase subunit C